MCFPEAPVTSKRDGELSLVLLSLCENQYILLKKVKTRKLKNVENVSERGYLHLSSLYIEVYLDDVAQGSFDSCLIFDQWMWRNT